MQQTFEGETTYKLGSRNTSGIFSLLVHNTTLVPEPLNKPRRYDELYYMTYSSFAPEGCGTTEAEQLALGHGDVLSSSSLGVPCTLWLSTAVYDWKWYSQTMVSICLLLCPCISVFRNQRRCRSVVLFSGVHVHAFLPMSAYRDGLKHNLCFRPVATINSTGSICTSEVTLDVLTRSCLLADGGTTSE